MQGRRRGAPAGTDAPHARSDEGGSDQPEIGGSSDGALTPRLVTLGNIVRRSASLRYRRLLDLPSTEYGIVGALGAQKPITIRKLADLLGMDPAQLSRALSNLEKRMLVSRAANATDSREVLVSLTPKGRDAYGQIARGRMERSARLVSLLSHEEAVLLDRILAKLTKGALELLDEEKEATAPPRTGATGSGR